MARSHQPWNMSLAVVGLAAFILGNPSKAFADNEPAARPSPWPWPCQLIVIGDLRAAAEVAWEHSPTFRDQCRKLAAARATMVIEPVTSRQTWRAKTRIGRTDAGLPAAHAYVRPADNTLELIAHELEHVLEYVGGVKFLLQASTVGSGVSLSAGAYETRRAIDAGLRVAQEVRNRGAGNPPLSKHSERSACAQNSTRNPNCH